MYNDLAIVLSTFSIIVQKKNKAYT